MSDDVDMSERQESSSPVLIKNDPQSGDTMEVAVVADARKTDLLKGDYTWKIENFSQFPDKEHSPTFEIGGFNWNLLLFPRGNQNQTNHQMSLYLAAVEHTNNSNWSRCAAFKLFLVNQANPDDSICKDARHNFTPGQNDWGFTSFHPINDINDLSRNFIVNDTLIIRVEIEITLPEDVVTYDSRAATGFVGLKNQGATCYMNSLLQTLYNVNEFRKTVYHMPTSEDSTAAESMPLALQSVFWKLQFSNSPVSTEDLTKSFGWDSMDAFQQHDVQELNRILCDRLEEKMKGTRVEGMINHLFEGHTLNYIDCINIEFKSTRREAFQDLQLDVKSCRNIYDSFDKYCEVETLEGDNKYEAEGHGKQDARKGVLFDALPPVLNLHLKRFEYDFQKDMMVKINDRHEFYDEIDLDRMKADGTTPEYLSSNADRKIRNVYKLLAVLVHSGTINGGHYYAYARPDGEQWLKFDDEVVEKADQSKAINDNWGGSGGDDDTTTAPVTTGFGTHALRVSSYSNAYMLVYVRKSEWDSIMCDVTTDDISDHVRTRLEAEQAEKERRKKERSEAHLHTLVRIATDDDLRKQIGHQHFFDLIEFDKVALTLKLKKATPFSEVIRHVEEHLDIPADRQRYWKWSHRQNNTLRPSSVLPTVSSADLLGDDVTVGSLSEFRRSGGRQGELVKFDLYLEVRPENKPFVEISKSTAFVFFKQYLPGDKKTPPRLDYVGKFFFSGVNKISDAIDVFKAMASLPKNAQLRVVEEVKFQPTVMIEQLEPSNTFIACKIELGDILIFQQQPTPTDEKNLAFPYVEDFMRHIINRVSVLFKPKESLENTATISTTNTTSTTTAAATDKETQGGRQRSSRHKKQDQQEEEQPDQAAPDHQEEEFHLDLFWDMSYDDVSKAVADHLGLDHPLKVRLTLYNQHTRLPRSQPVPYGGASRSLTSAPTCTLEEMTLPAFSNGVKPIDPLFYYEIIDRPLPEFQSLARVTVAFHNAKHDEVMTLTVCLPKDKHIRDLLEEVRKELPAKEHQNAPLRFMEIYQWKIWQIYNNEDVIATTVISSNVNHWRVEVVPDDQRLLDQPGQLHVQCLQVEESQNKIAFPCSDPFVMALGEKETVGELKERVKNELEISDEEFEKWKVVLVEGQRMGMEPLDDDGQIIAERLNASYLDGSKLYGHILERQMIGFMHENKNPRRTHAHIRNASFYGQDRALKIKG